MRSVAISLLFLLTVSAPASLVAQSIKPEAAGESAKPGETESDADQTRRVLTPEELAEKEARKACKKKICDIIATRDSVGEDIACDIVKTWREEDIVKMLGGRIN